MKVKLILALLMGALAIPVTANDDIPTVSEFAAQVEQKHGIGQQTVISLLAGATKSEAILEAIARPWEAKPWYQYYPIFLTNKRLNTGLAFWQEHSETLAKAEQTYGVPAEIIVAIIGVETFYGAYTGKYPVLDALYTLGFHYPPRATFFRRELENFLLLINEEGFDPNALKGSYAGAMGWGQFISSSYRNYAVDFDGDKVRDLLNNPVDAIGSVANYFHRHGWKPGEDVAYPVKHVSADVSALLTDTLTYQHQWQQLQQGGVTLAQPLTPEQSVKLLGFEQENDTEYWVGLPNFYVITRYNHSPLYAMAVYQLSEQLKHAKRG